MKQQGKYRAGLLGLIAIGAMAFAASAQAVTDAQSGFFINGSQVGTLKASFDAKQLERGTLSIPALNTEINCEKFTITNGFINSTTDAEVTVLYEECAVLSIAGGLFIYDCKIIVNKTDKRPHITASALLLGAELEDGSQNGASAILAEKIQATVLMEEGTECVLPEITKITGEACIKIVKEGKHANETVEPELEASKEFQNGTWGCHPRLTLEGIQATGGTPSEIGTLEAAGKVVLDKLLYGVNEAFLTGNADVHLTNSVQGGVLKVHLGLSLAVLLI